MKCYYTLIFFALITKITGQSCEVHYFNYKNTLVCKNIEEKFKNITKLSYSLMCINCNLPVLDKTTIIGPFRGDVLNLSNSNIQKIESDAFKNFWPTVKQFVLDQNYIETLPLDIFKSFTNLKSINLQLNKLQKLYSKQFENVTVEQLNLSKNNLDNISGAFDFLNVQFLDISYNKLVEIPSFTFKNMKVMSYFNYLNDAELRLSNNLISKVYNGSFVLKGNLRKLTLSYNYLTKLENNTFENLQTLKSLYIDNNLIEELQPAAFRFLKELLFLNLSSNRLSFIPFGVFSELNELKRLSLDSNNLMSLQDTSFTGLSSLEILNISNNNIKDLKDSYIFPLGKLNYLDISSNHLTTFDIEQILSHHVKLKIIVLSDNFWTCKALVKIYKALNKINGEFKYPSKHYNVPNLHGIACSRLPIPLNENMNFKEFLDYISQDMIIEDLYNVQLSGDELLINNSNEVKYLQNIYNILISFFIVVIIFMLLFLFFNFKNNCTSSFLSYMHLIKSDNVEML